MALYGEGAHWGLRLAVAGPLAAVTAPGAGAGQGPGANGAGTPLVRKNAEFPGKFPVMRFGECTREPDATRSVVENACNYSERYGLESGFKRCVPRLSGATGRASLFSQYVPSPTPSPDQYAYDASCEKKAAPQFRVQAYCFVAGVPSSYSLRGSLGIRDLCASLLPGRRPRYFCWRLSGRSRR